MRKYRVTVTWEPTEFKTRGLDVGYADYFQNAWDASVKVEAKKTRAHFEVNSHNELVSLFQEAELVCPEKLLYVVERL